MIIPKQKVFFILEKYFYRSLQSSRNISLENLPDKFLKYNIVQVTTEPEPRPLKSFIFFACYFELGIGEWMNNMNYVLVVGALV